MGVRIVRGLTGKEKHPGTCSIGLPHSFEGILLDLKGGHIRFGVQQRSPSESLLMRRFIGRGVGRPFRGSQSRHDVRGVWGQHAR